VLSTTSVASSTNCSHRNSANKRDCKRCDPRNASEQQRRYYRRRCKDQSRRHRAADLTCSGVTNYTTLFTDYRTYLPITRHIYRLHDSNCRNQKWFLQLESCNSGSANPHGYVGHSGLHDIDLGAECQRSSRVGDKWRTAFSRNRQKRQSDGGVITNPGNHQRIGRFGNQPRFPEMNRETAREKDYICDREPGAHLSPDTEMRLPTLSAEKMLLVVDRETVPGT